MKNRLYFLTFLSVVFISCGGNGNSIATETSAPNHELCDQLVKKHVSADGNVSYKGFIADSALLNKYLALLSDNEPNELIWSEQEQLAYWINAYNAFTVKLIADHYPVKSIRDLDPTLYIPLLNTVWHIKFFTIGGKEFNLDQIEHSILRKQFNEPRIHFAIVCASYSCPPLRTEAYTVENMETQLEDQTRRFINDPKRNVIREHEIELSSIFNWFKGDFTKNETLIAFLNRYSTAKISEAAQINYMDYNWTLNE